MEKPQHEVTLSQGFWLGKYELTQGQWEAVMGTTPWAGQREVHESATNPAVYISWDDVQVLVTTLNAAAGADAYRLPTEAEWEYACRAGTTARYSFGDDEGELGEYAWYRSNAHDMGHYGQQVGTKLANGWGLHDMHGNALEWVADWIGSYSSGPQTDPPGETTGSKRVLRGGCWYTYDQATRSAWRGDDAPGNRNSAVGVRLLMSSAAPTACACSASPSNITAPWTQDNGNVALTATPSGCEWTATSDVDWITFRSGMTGGDVGSSVTGTGSSAFYTTHENTGSGERTGHITVGGATVAFTQEAPPCSYADLNGDGVVDFSDFFLFADHFGTKCGDQDWDPLYDLVANCVVDYEDFFAFADCFGSE